VGDATYGRYQKIIHRFTLSLPTNSVETEKTARWAAQVFEIVRGRPPRSDSDIRVTADEVTLTYFFEEPEVILPPAEGVVVDG
jgi:hypothetical protein